MGLGERAGMTHGRRSKPWDIAQAAPASRRKDFDGKVNQIAHSSEGHQSPTEGGHPHERERLSHLRLS